MAQKCFSLTRGCILKEQVKIGKCKSEYISSCFEKRRARERPAALIPDRNYIQVLMLKGPYHGKAAPTPAYDLLCRNSFVHNTACSCTILFRVNCFLLKMCHSQNHATFSLEMGYECL